MDTSRLGIGHPLKAGPIGLVGLLSSKVRVRKLVNLRKSHILTVPSVEEVAPRHLQLQGLGSIVTGRGVRGEKQYMRAHVENECNCNQD